MVSGVSDGLASARTKLKRANLHAGIARREAVRFFRRHPQPTFHAEDKREGTEVTRHVGDVIEYRIVVTTAPPELPESFSARFGDAIHNYRCVLDHIAWQLVRHGTRWPLNKKEAVRVQFPIYLAKADFLGQIGDRLPGVNADAIRFIQERQGYVGGKASNLALLGLKELSNDDKHRSLHLFLSLFRNMASEATFIRCVPVEIRNPAVRPELKEGAVMTHFSYRVTEPDPQVVVEVRPTVQIVIEDGRDFSEMLEGIRGEVTAILNAPEIIAAVT